MPGRDGVVLFQLYVAGESPNSLRARSNLLTFCEKSLPGRSEVEIIDVFLAPERASEERVYITPLLVVLASRRVLKIYGDLSDLDALRETLRTEE